MTRDYVADCEHNLRTADSKLQAARERLTLLDQPGPERQETWLLCRRYLAEREHWREYAEYYRKLQEAAPRPVERPPLRVVRPPEPDRRLPRESEEVPFDPF